MLPCIRKPNSPEPPEAIYQPQHLNLYWMQRGNHELLCASNTVLAHDIYSNLRDRDGHLCCGGQDCEPVKVIVLMAITICQRVGKLKTIADDRFHHCTYYPMANEYDRRGPVWESKPKTRCFFAPMNSS